MIVLDTNQLVQAKPPNGPFLSMLKVVAKHAGLELALPEIVLEEHLARFTHDLETLHHNAQKALRVYRAKLPWPNSDEVPPLDSAAAEASYAESLRATFRILPTPEWAAMQSLIREARRRPPASREWSEKGEGARDVAIWLTAIDAARSSDDPVYFVSMDKKAFGANSLFPELQQDLRDYLGDGATSFHYCCGIESLLKEFAQQHDRVPTRNAIGAAEPVRQALRRVLTGSEAFFQLISGLGLTGRGYVASRVGEQTLNLLAVHKIIGYQVDGKLWAAATVDWRISERVTASFIDREGMPSKDFNVAFKLVTTLLIELDEDGRITEAECVPSGHIREIEAGVAS
ncbi:DUF4935 domain-containing protein [Herbidospora sp. NEAU-GS84]|uniref:DUF4935 domain-containing protein n=1 Tax=Herbidospora solisilvae TaxID=2696284 RepID=A0A7C9NE63_9ACTN|nr:PIN domain-containing protein [Herbidospora solisilvae]NAS22515.1 DUF4935 domain-containing protein [Herbidospora solisilvae]